MRFVFLCSCWLVGQSLLHAQSWTLSTRAPLPEPVTNNAVVEGFANGTPYVYSFGGLDSTKRYSGIHRRSYRYNTRTDVWDTLPPLPDTLGKIALSANRVRDKIYLIGGYHVYANGSERSANTVHIFNPRTNRYEPDGAPIPVPIDDQVQAVWRDSLLYVITGWSNTSNRPNVQIYNPSNDQWQQGTRVPNNSLYMAFGASGAIVGDTIYYFGGATMAGNFNRTFFFRKGVIDPSDPTQITWSHFSQSSIWGYRTAAVAALGKVFWIGGSDKTYNYNGIAYDGSGGVPPNGQIIHYGPRDGSFRRELGYALPMDLRGIATLNDTMHYLAGGMMANQRVTNQTLRLQLTADSVRYTTSHRLPDASPRPLLTVGLQPNPTRQTVRLTLRETTTARYAITTASGIVLRQGRCTAPSQTLDVGDLVPGLYWIAVEAGDRHGGQWLQIHP